MTIWDYRTYQDARNSVHDVFARAETSIENDLDGMLVTVYTGKEILGILDKMEKAIGYELAGKMRTDD